MKGARFLLPAILKTVLLPPVLTLILLACSPLRLHWSLRFISVITAWPALYIVRSHISLLSSARAARALGARPVPRVEGRWPLNLDVLADWSKSGSEEEVGRMMVLLSRRYGGTYNTRVLGEDQVSPALRCGSPQTDASRLMMGPDHYVGSMCGQARPCR